jgi:hypothetical protein
VHAIDDPMSESRGAGAVDDDDAEDEEEEADDADSVAEDECDGCVTVSGTLDEEVSSVSRID